MKTTCPSLICAVKLSAAAPEGPGSAGFIPRGLSLPGSRSAPSWGCILNAGRKCGFPGPCRSKKYITKLFPWKTCGRMQENFGSVLQWGNTSPSAPSHATITERFQILEQFLLQVMQPQHHHPAVEFALREFERFSPQAPVSGSDRANRVEPPLL